MERGGAFCASVLFHVLLLLVLGSSSSFDITLGERSRFDVIFWISAASTAPQGGSPPSVRKSAPAPARQAGAAVKPRAAIAAANRIKVPRSATAPRPATGNFPGEPPASRPPAGLAIVDAPAEGLQPLPPAWRPPPPSPAVKAETAAASPEQSAEVAAKGVAGLPEPEQGAIAAPPIPVRLGAFREDWGAADTTSSGNHEVAAAAEKAPSEAAAASEPSAPVERREQSRRGAPQADRAAAGRAEHPAPVRSGPPAQKPPEPRGIVTTSLQGDLKMIVNGESVRLLVAFREFPKSRRDRPLRRSEAPREQRIQPVVARTHRQTREAVVETARDGVYIFAAEPEQGEKAQATFTLKLFETGRRERTVELGTRSISGKTVLARVLMRDGILWDDQSAFTGSFEDSEGTTRYNANTGLYWKEFHY